MTSYDVVVIGSGTAGQTAAYALKAKGLNVAVAEKSDAAGGICALAGCQAKKWFYEGAEIVAKSRHLNGKGVVSAPKVAWDHFLREKNKFTAAVPGGTLKGLGNAGIDVISGTARFLDERTLDVSGRRLSSRFFVIASGARPMSLPIAGIEHAITSDRFLDLPSLSNRFVFIGGGFISFEFAHFVTRLGDMSSRQTTILEAAARPLGPFDSEMVSLLVAASAAEGIDVHTRVQISAIEQSEKEFKVIAGDNTAFSADVVVNAAGRLPDISELDLDRADVAHSRKGIAVNTRMQTNQPHIYAVGDCAATIQLARVADYEAMVAANAILSAGEGNACPEMNYAAVPAVLFTYPQYGMVGYTEDTLKHEGIPYERSFEENLSWPTYRRIGMRSAAYKILVGESGQFLGAHVLSDNATGIVNTIRLAMLNRISVDTLYVQSIMSPYPSRESDLLYMLKPLAKISL
jgi:glutathione reductase (NADPH)